MGWKCYSRVWVKQELWGGGPWARRSILFTQPKNGFRRPALKTGTKLHKSSLTPPVKDLDFHESSRSLKKLVKPFFFTIGFSGCAFGTAAIWQYEHLRTKFQNYFENAQADWLDRIQPQKGLRFRKQFTFHAHPTIFTKNGYFVNHDSFGYISTYATYLLIFGGTVLATGNGLCQCDFCTQYICHICIQEYQMHRFIGQEAGNIGNGDHMTMDDCSGATAPRQPHICQILIPWKSWVLDFGRMSIIAANVFVFCLWRIPALSRIMVTYFTSNPASRVLCFPMLLSTFSHFSFLHMVANMYVLWSFSTSIVSILGREQFMAVYLSAGVVSTFVSYVCKMATGKFGPSLGASGAIMAVLGAVCTKIPEAKLAIIFLPMFTFTAGNALKAIIALDSVGLILGWRFFDHASHLGGVLFGIWYVMYGNKIIWNNREPVVKAWHTVKTWRPNK